MAAKKEKGAYVVLDGEVELVKGPLSTTREQLRAFVDSSASMVLLLRDNLGGLVSVALDEDWCLVVTRVASGEVLGRISLEVHDQSELDFLGVLLAGLPADGGNDGGGDDEVE